MVFWIALFSAGCVADSSFSAINDEVFQNSCVFSSCHSSGNGAGDLSLESEAYEELVDVAAQGEDLDGDEVRVIPGDPDSSYLIWKLEGDDRIVEDPMPPNGSSLADRDIKRIRKWIEDGALDD